MGFFHFQLEPIMASRRQIRLPRQWPEHVKSGILHAIVRKRPIESIVGTFAQVLRE
jgi:hypothetical protein